MEETTTALGTVFESITTVITKMVELLSTVSAALLNNIIFQIMIGIAFAFIIIGIIIRLVKKMRKGGR